MRKCHVDEIDFDNLQVDIAFAAATPAGLVTPVIRQAGEKKISEVCPDDDLKIYLFFAYGARCLECKRDQPLTGTR